MPTNTKDALAAVEADGLSLKNALATVRDKGFGEDVDADSVIEAAAKALLNLSDSQSTGFDGVTIEFGDGATSASVLHLLFSGIIEHKYTVEFDLNDEHGSYMVGSIETIVQDEEDATLIIHPADTPSHVRTELPFGDVKTIRIY